MEKNENFDSLYFAVYLDRIKTDSAGAKLLANTGFITTGR